MSGEPDRQDESTALRLHEVDSDGHTEASRRRIAEMEAALRTLVTGYYSDDESLPTLEQWDDARSLVSGS